MEILRDPKTGRLLGRPITIVERGKTYNMLTAIAFAGKNKTNNFMWQFQCDCGIISDKIASKVVSGDIKSCGCLRRAKVPTHKKQCSDCFLMHSLDSEKRRKDPEKGKRIRENGAAHLKRKRAKSNKFVYGLLQKSKCIDCGDDRWQVLEFDHVRGKKKAAISAMKASSISTIQKEIEKCDIVCANCHRLRTYEREGSRQSASRNEETAQPSSFNEASVSGFSP